MTAEAAIRYHRRMTPSPPARARNPDLEPGGYARALGKHVVHCAKTGTSLPFDIRGVRHVFYDTPIDLQEKLVVELREHFASSGDKTGQT